MEVRSCHCWIGLGNHLEGRKEGDIVVWKEGAAIVGLGQATIWMKRRRYRSIEERSRHCWAGISNHLERRKELH